MNSLVFSTLQCVMPDNGGYFRPTPKQPKANELPLIVTDFRIAAHNAIKAGFDGVEITSANSYIIDEFLNDHVNNRIGENGGSIENRCRPALEIIGAVMEEIEADRVGVKHSLFSEVYGKKTRTQKLYWLIWRVNSLSSEFYIYMCLSQGTNLVVSNQLGRLLRGRLLLLVAAIKLREMKQLLKVMPDLVSFGRLFLANPDLPKRFEVNAPLNKYDRSTFYRTDPVVGYTDYPCLEIAC